MPSYCSLQSICCQLWVVVLNFIVSCCVAITCFDHLRCCLLRDKSIYVRFSIMWFISHSMNLHFLVYSFYIFWKSSDSFFFFFILKCLFCLYCSLSLNFSLGNICFHTGCSTFWKHVPLVDKLAFLYFILILNSNIICLFWVHCSYETQVFSKLYIIQGDPSLLWLSSYTLKCWNFQLPSFSVPEILYLFAADTSK